MMRHAAALLASMAAALLGACAAMPPGDVLPVLSPQQMADESRLVVVAIDNGDVAGPPRPASTRPGYQGGAYASSAAALATMRTLAREYSLTEVTAWPIGVLDVHCAVLRIAAGSSREQLLQRMVQDPRIRIAQPMNGFEPRGGAYNDPYEPLQTGFRSIDAASAQRWSRGAKVRVAVIDTGLDTQHPDFGGRIVVQRNFVDGDSARFRRDRHGTAVAGVISAAANNQLGIVGVAPDARIIALKACWEAGPPGQGARCNSLTLALALAAAIEERARVVNLSLAGPRDPLLNALVAAGSSRGIVYVGAAPASDPDDAFPAGAPGVIGVDMAEEGRSSAQVLRAPGQGVVTLVPGGSYDFLSGPSLATAHVSGTVALLLAVRDDLDRDALYDMLSRSGTQINACAALAELAPGRAADCAGLQKKDAAP